MDKKKEMIRRISMTVALLLTVTVGVVAQSVSKIQFCDKKYKYKVGSDSITIFIKVLDRDGNHNKDITAQELEDYLVVKEGGNAIPNDRRVVKALNSGQRIPPGYTFSVLIDLSIPDEGKSQIYDAVEHLVASAPDSCVYLSFFGDEVSSSEMVTKASFKTMKDRFLQHADNKFLYRSLCAKLCEFDPAPIDNDYLKQALADYAPNATIAQRAKANPDNNILFIFTEGDRYPSMEMINRFDVEDIETDLRRIVPRVFAFYYTPGAMDENVETMLKNITTPKDSTDAIIASRRGDYQKSSDINKVLSSFQRVIDDAMYDFAYTYKIEDGKSYSGRVNYLAEWKGVAAGEADFSIGTAETPWPLREQTTTDILVKILWALLITLLTICLAIAVMKILIPWIKSRTFAAKYYRKFVPKENVTRELCYYCKRPFEPGEMVVQRCKHVMHVHCWKHNHYRCAEYGQNCTEGIQDHIEWKQIFSKATLRDCYLTIMGVFAGFISWIIYELFGHGFFGALAKTLAAASLSDEAQQLHLMNVENKTNAFLTIGLLLGFFLSLIFRFNDEYRQKNWKVIAKIIGLSIFSGIVGMLAFALGAYILGVLLSLVKTTYIPWYCSLPAYILFSIFVSLSLTVKSTIPVKSALLGGLCSAVIGFLVLYFSKFTSDKMSWMNMLLDFIIYGGGLGASLVTVRMLAEKYFLVIMNGVRAKTRIPIHKWMNATGGGQKVTIGMTVNCEIQMNWEKSNNVQKEHAQLFIDRERMLPMIKPLGPAVIYNNRVDLPVGKPTVLSNGDTFKIGDTMFKYIEE